MHSLPAHAQAIDSGGGGWGDRGRGRGAISQCSGRRAGGGGDADRARTPPVHHTTRAERTGDARTRRRQGRWLLRRAPGAQGVRVGRAPARARRRVRAEDRRADHRRAREHEGRPDEARPDGQLPRRRPARAGPRAARRAPAERAADERRARRGRGRDRAGDAARQGCSRQWDPVPLASASIGQVHRAITHDDRAVAVKVQYPGIDEAIRADLANADLLFQGVGMLFPGLDPAPLVEELRSRVLEELDYDIEASNQSYFADEYRDHPFIHVPDVLPELQHAARAHHRARRGQALRRDPRAGPRRSGTSRRRRSTGSCSAASTGCTRSTATRTRATTCSGPAGRSRSSTSGSSSTSRPTRSTSSSTSSRPWSSTTTSPRSARASSAPACSPPGAPFGDQEIEDYFGHFYEFVQEDQTITITPDWSVSIGAALLRPQRSLRRDRQGREPAAGVRDHPADQPRAVRDPRSAPRDGELPPDRQRAVAVRRRAAVDADG